MPSRRCKSCGERKDVEDFPFSHKSRGLRRRICLVCYREEKNANARTRAEVERARRALEERKRCEECSHVKRISLFPSRKATVCNRCVTSLNRETGLRYVDDYSYLLSTISENKKRPLRLLTIRGSV